MSNIISTITTWLHSGPKFRWSDVVSMRPNSEWHFMYAYVALIAIFLILAIINWRSKRIHADIKEKLASYFWTNIWLALPIWFFRTYQIPLFGMDLWRYLQYAMMLVWPFFIFNYRRKVIPVKLKEDKIAEYKNKYLPKTKAK